LANPRSSLHCEDVGSNLLKDGVQPAQDAHGQDDVLVLAAFEEAAQNVVGDAPEE